MRQIFKIFLTAKHAKPTFAKATVGKKDAERTKSKSYSSVLCDLCVIPIAIGTLRPTPSLPRGAVNGFQFF